MTEDCTAWARKVELPDGSLSSPRVIIENGKVVIATDCPCDCLDKVFVIATKTTSRTSPSWDLTPYKFAGKYHVNARWRLIEGSGTYYGGGKIAKHEWGGRIRGELVGLPDKFTSKYSYQGYMKLQQGCYDPHTGNTTWP